MGVLIPYFHPSTLVCPSYPLCHFVLHSLETYIKKGIYHQMIELQLVDVEQNMIVNLPLPSLLLECPLSDEFALGFELVEIVDSAGEDALESWAKLSRNVAVSPSVKLFRRFR